MLPNWIHQGSGVLGDLSGEESAHLGWGSVDVDGGGAPEPACGLRGNAKVLLTVMVFCA